jgi:putative DNA primase/helicase
MGIGTDQISDFSDKALPPATDAGRAEAFIKDHGAILRYVAEWKSWIIWDGERWIKDNISGRLIYQLVDKHARAILGRASKEPREWLRRELSMRALQLGSAQKREAMLKLARHDETVSVSLRQIDADPWLLGVANGVVNLRTGRLLKSDRNRLVTKQAGATHNAKAKCPRWLQFLDEIFAGDRDLIEFVQILFGYALTGKTTEQCFAFLYGIGANGKSTLVETLLGVFGDYARRVGKNLIAKNRSGGQPEHEIAELHGCRLAIASEVADGDRMNEDIIKDITGGDTLRGCRKYEHAFQFESQSLLVIYGNHKPDVRGTDDGIWRRVRLIPFRAQFAKEKADKDLPQKLAAQADGILQWLLQGCLKWQKNGLTAPNTVMEAVEAYKNDSDILADFIEEELVIDQNKSLTRSELYVAYQTWSKNNGYQPLSRKTFTARFRDRGIGYEGRPGGIRGWLGIGFRPASVSFADIDKERPWQKRQQNDQFPKTPNTTKL